MPIHGLAEAPFYGRPALLFKARPVVGLEFPITFEVKPVEEETRPE